jgi:hypothetical protein
MKEKVLGEIRQLTSRDRRGENQGNDGGKKHFYERR